MVATENGEREMGKREFSLSTLCTLLLQKLEALI